MATFLNRCCVNKCQLGAVIPRLQNVTRVRPVGDTLPAHYTVTPYPRFSPLSIEFDCANSPTNPVPSGACGGWLFGGDLHGVSAQVINDTVNDIMACGGFPIAANDHNCYQQNGTIDMRVSKLFGWQGVLAQKFWHGTFGLTSNDGCPAPNPNIAADQTKYLTVSLEYAYNVTGYGEGPDGSGDHSPDVVVSVLDGSGSGSASINPTTGVMTGISNSAEKGQIRSIGILFTEYDITNGGGLWKDGKTYATGLATAGDQLFGINYCCRALPLVPAGGINSFGTLQQLIDAYNIFAGASLPAISSSPDNYHQSGSHTIPNGPSGTHSMSVDVSITRTNTSLSWSATWSEFIDVEPEDDPLHENTAQTVSFSGSVTLSNPYTAQACFNHWTAALNTWDMSNMTLANLRGDSQLANLPLCLYDEIDARSPMGQFIPPTMNDLGAGLVNDVNGVAPGASGYLTTWAQRPWIDPLNFIWIYADGSFDNPSNLTSGATIKTPMFDGTIVSHNVAGSDRHFWFGYLRMERDLVPDGTDPSIMDYEWFDNATGDYSDPNLPAASMRWQNNEEAQYDPIAFRNNVPPNPGNYPQAWWTQKNGLLLGAKYIQATQTWPSVNYGRPCGADKFSADQLTICCVMASTPGTFYSVKITANANAPGTVGGINVNDFIIIENDGYYPVVNIHDDGNQSDGSGDTWHQYTLQVGAKIDSPPTGYNIGRVTSNDGGDLGGDPTLPADVVYLGKLRFPGYAGICGRVAISSILPTIPQPYLRKDPASGTIAVDLYDAQMNLVKGNTQLTRVDDSTFTFASGVITAPVWMVATGFDWTKYDASPKRTGVHLEWSFNQRAAAPGFTGPPAWYGGLAGVMGVTATQFNYVNGNCAAVVGIVPAGSPEAFENSNLFNFPAPIFDDIFGGFYQGAVMLTMPDPNWQPNFNPDGGVFFPTSLVWQQDNGTGEADQTIILESGHTQYQYFFPHHPLVEASCNQVSPLPPGISLPLDPTKNVILPPYYPNGIPLGDTTGGYATLDTDWGFKTDACQPANRFAANYLQFVQC